MVATLENGLLSKISCCALHWGPDSHNNVTAKFIAVKKYIKNFLKMSINQK